MSTTKPTTALLVKRSFRQSPEKVFRAFSSAELMSQWFYSGKDWSADIESDFREGGAYRVTMRSPKGDVIPHTGIYKEISPARKLVFTWNSAYAKNSLVTIHFEPKDGGTEMTLCHEFLAEDMRLPHQEGWGACFDNLETWVSK